MKWDLSQVATGVIAFAMFVLTLQTVGAMLGAPVSGEIVGGMVTLILGALGAEGIRHRGGRDDDRGGDPDGPPPKRPARSWQGRDDGPLLASAR